MITTIASILSQTAIEFFFAVSFSLCLFLASQYIAYTPRKPEKSLIYLSHSSRSVSHKVDDQKILAEMFRKLYVKICFK